MSFYKDNKYYITQNLQVGMRGLSSGEKQAKYNLISPDVRARIIKSYPLNNFALSEINDTELNFYYKELFELVGEFELNYILANLFFETNFSNIILFLKNNSIIFSNLMIAPFEPFTFKWLINLYLNGFNLFQITLIEFLKKLISNHTNLTDKDLEVTISDRGNVVFEFVHKYPKWMMDNLVNSSDIAELSFIHLIIIKFFNLNKIFISHEKRNTFAILFLHKSSEYYNEKINNGKTPRLSLFYSKMNGIIDSFFIKDQILKTPILDSSVDENYSKGFYLKRENFLKQVEEAEILNGNLQNESFGSLFKLYFSGSILAKQKLIKDITNRIKNYEMPTSDEFNHLDQIFQSESVEEIKKLIYRKFYLFQNQ